MSERIPIILAILVFSTLSIRCAVTSQGFLEADGCTHYMYARWAFQYPVYFVDIWGRPFKTALYAPAAATVGLIGVRVTSLAVAIAISFIAYFIAKGQGYRWPALALIFVLAQPLVFLHSFSELTELPFAMLLGAAFLAYQRRRCLLVALLCGLLPLSRPEGFGFLILTMILLAAHRRWALLPVLLVPVLAWQIVGAILYHQPGEWWRWLVLHWPYAGESLYESGSILHFAALMPAVVGPMLFPFVLIGLVNSVHHEGTKKEGIATVQDKTSLLRGFVMNHRFRCDVLIAAIPLMILIGHSVLYALGKMASNGEARYMLIVAPFWALLAGRGWEWVWERFVIAPSSDTPGTGLRSPYRWAAVAALLPIVANWGYKVLPLVQTEDWKMAARIAVWYQTSGIASDYPYLLAAHPGIAYALDWSLLDPRLREWNIENVARAPGGTVLIYDDMYGRHNADRRKSVDEAMIGENWIGDMPTIHLLDPIPAFDASSPSSGSIRWAICLSEHANDGQPTAPDTDSTRPGVSPRWRRIR